MPGMKSGIGVGNVLIAEAFRSALRHQLRLIAVSQGSFPGLSGAGHLAVGTAAARLFAVNSGRVQLAAIVLSPTYRSLAAMQAFDRQEGLARLPNWLYMTGTLAELKKVWHAYGVTAQDLPGRGDDVA